MGERLRRKEKTWSLTHLFTFCHGHREEFPVTPTAYVYRIGVFERRSQVAAQRCSHRDFSAAFARTALKIVFVRLVHLPRMSLEKQHPPFSAHVLITNIISQFLFEPDYLPSHLFAARSADLPLWITSPPPAGNLSLSRSVSVSRLVSLSLSPSFPVSAFV